MSEEQYEQVRLLQEQNEKLKKENKSLNAQLVQNYHLSSRDIEKCDTKKFLGSGVILEITTIGGSHLVGPVLIRNGLSEETIKAIKADFVRSYEEAIEFKP